MRNWSIVGQLIGFTAVLNQMTSQKFRSPQHFKELSTAHLFLFSKRLIRHVQHHLPPYSSGHSSQQLDISSRTTEVSSGTRNHHCIHRNGKAAWYRQPSGGCRFGQCNSGRMSGAARWNQGSSALKNGNRTPIASGFCIRQNCSNSDNSQGGKEAYRLWPSPEPQRGPSCASL